MKKFRLSNGLANIILCVVVLLAGVLTLVNVFCWEITQNDVNYIKELMAQGYTYQQAYDEVCEMKGTADVYGTGGIDGICKYGTHATTGTGSSSKPTTSPKPKHTHSWKEEVIKDPTCIEEGEVKYSCDCGETKTIKTEILPHTYSLKEDKPATCVEHRTLLYECSVCGDKYIAVMEEEGFAEHIYIPTEDSSVPTCTESGVVHYVCNVCGNSYDQEIEALGHEYNDYTVDKEASCTEKGLKSLHCSRCDEIKEGSEVEISEKGHTENERHEIQDATFWNDGLETVTCRDCGVVLSSSVIPAIGGQFRIIIPVGIGLVVIAIIVLIALLTKKKGK